MSAAAAGGDDAEPAAPPDEPPVEGASDGEGARDMETTTAGPGGTRAVVDAGAVAHAERRSAPI